MDRHCEIVDSIFRAMFRSVVTALRQRYRSTISGRPSASATTPDKHFDGIVILRMLSSALCDTSRLGMWLEIVGFNSGTLALLLGRPPTQQQDGTAHYPTNTPTLWRDIPTVVLLIARYPDYRLCL